MNEFKEIDAHELKKLLSDFPNQILIVDVRTKEEYDQAHIKDSFLLELKSFNQIELEKKCDTIKDLKAVVFQCRIGARSATAIMQLTEEMPYEIYNLKGGILSWSSYGYDIVSLNTKTNQ